MGGAGAGRRKCVSPLSPLPFHPIALRFNGPRSRQRPARGLEYPDLSATVHPYPTNTPWTAAELGIR